MSVILSADMKANREKKCHQLLNHRPTQLLAGS